MTKAKQLVKMWVVNDPVIGKGMLGEVIEHPFHCAGTAVCTTAVIAINDDGTVETKNSIYTLIKG